MDEPRRNPWKLVYNEYWWNHCDSSWLDPQHKHTYVDTDKIFIKLKSWKIVIFSDKTLQTEVTVSIGMTNNDIENGFFVNTKEWY